MANPQRRAAKAHLIAGMLRGQPWQEAAAQAGHQISQATAYRLLSRFRTEGQQVWKMGGMDMCPSCVSRCGSGWMRIAVPARLVRAGRSRPRSASALVSGSVSATSTVCGPRWE
jgi:hypothetical protein